LPDRLANVCLVCSFHLRVLADTFLAITLPAHLCEVHLLLCLHSQYTCLIAVLLANYRFAHDQGRELRLTASDRVGVYRQLVSLMKAHFGDDALGRRKAWYFLPWHFSFFHR
jgi:hypothetical protein